MTDERWISEMEDADRLHEREDCCSRCRQPDHECICNVTWLRPFRLIKNDDGPGGSNARAA